MATEAELLRHLSADLHVNSKNWLTGDPKHSFQNWRKILPKRGKIYNTHLKNRGIIMNPQYLFIYCELFLGTFRYV